MNGLFGERVNSQAAIYWVRYWEGGRHEICSRTSAVVERDDGRVVSWRRIRGRRRKGKRCARYRNLASRPVSFIDHRPTQFVSIDTNLLSKLVPPFHPSIHPLCLSPPPLPSLPFSLSPTKFHLTA